MLTSKPPMASSEILTPDAPPTFDVLPLSDDIRRAVDDLGFVHPTPVQRAVFEPTTRGRDLVVQARTGTGKTAAFGLPIIDVLVRRSTPAVQALVLCPTRELALQVTRDLVGIAKHRGAKVAAVYGGAPMPRQVQEIRDGAQIVVGTPGRVLDHLQRGTFDPKAVRVLVLDESDEMLSMGFLPQINDILSHLPEQRQTMLFSATLPADIRRMAETRLRDPEFITLSGDHVGALEIDHFVYLTRGDKLGELIKIIEVENPESAIVFCNTRDETKRVWAALVQQGWAAEWLNADLPQNDREKVMEQTRRGQLRFLVCTDVAARGIDISHLTHVINYDFPESAEAYVHRTGRTGRAGRTGTAIALVAPSDVGNLYFVRLLYKIRPIEKQLPSARELKTRQEADLVEMFADLYASREAHPDDLALARRLLTHERAELVVAALLREHLGARPEAKDEATAARRSRAPRPAPSQAPVPEPVQAALRPEPPEQHAEPPAQRAEPPAQRPEPPVQRAEPPVQRAEPPAPRPEPPAPPAGTQADDRMRHDERGLRAPPPLRDRPRRRRRREGFSGDGEPRYEMHDLPPDHRELAEPASDPRSAPRSEPPPAPTGDVAEVYVNVGRRDGAKPSDFEDVLAERGVLAGDTEYVHVRHRHSFVGVKKDALDRAIEALSGATIAGKLVSAEQARPRS
jgi:ATP-dependent RNA helicase DeaD